VTDQQQLNEDVPILDQRLERFRRELALDDPAFGELVQRVGSLADWIVSRKQAKSAQRGGEAYVLGITGAQGSGKTTLSRLLALLLEARRQRSAQLSLDDLYLTHAERRVLRDQCKWYLFRGPFGTHDLALGMEVLRDLKHCRDGDSIRIPVFDKALNSGEGDRLPVGKWQTVSGPLDVVLFEGWCLGARPVADNELAEPINEIEASPVYDDREGTFRRRLNAELRRYLPLFGEMDDLAVLHVGSVERIYRWRLEQEQGLKRRAGGGMDVDTLRRFVDYFLPTTERYILPIGEHPEGRASVVVELGDGHRITGLRFVESADPPRRMR